MLSTAAFNRAVEDARGASEPCGVHPGHDGSPEGARDHPLALPAIRLPPHFGRGHCIAPWRYLCERGRGVRGEALDLIAHRAEGGMRNALTSLEQLIAFGEGEGHARGCRTALGGVDTNDLAEIVRFIGQRDVAACFRWTAEYVETGADLAQFARDLSEHVRNLYVMSLTDADVALEVGATERRQLTGELPLFGSDRLARLAWCVGRSVGRTQDVHESTPVIRDRGLRAWCVPIPTSRWAGPCRARGSARKRLFRCRACDGCGSCRRRFADCAVAPPIASSPASNTAALAAQAASTALRTSRFPCRAGKLLPPSRTGEVSRTILVQTLVQTPSAVSDPAAPPVPASGSCCARAECCGARCGPRRPGCCVSRSDGERPL